MSKKLLKSLLVELQSLRTLVASGSESKLAAIYPDTMTAPTTKKVKDKGKQKYSTEHSPTLFRYIRPIDEYTGDIDSQKGVTLKLSLDYKARVVNFSYSICNHKKGEPSFSKKEGQRLATEHPVYTIPLWKKPGRLSDTDITNFVLSAIANKQVDVPVGDRKNILGQYEASEANFWLDLED